MSPFALILCGGPVHTSLVLGALASSTDLVHLPCSRNQLPDLTLLSASALERSPLLVLSGVRSCVYLTHLSSELLEQGIECASAWVESRLPRSLDAGFHPFDLDYFVRLEGPAKELHRISPLLAAHMLHSASEIGLNATYRVELPIGEVVLSTPTLEQLSPEADCLAEAKQAGQRYCQAFNRALPSTCSRCGKAVARGLPCFSCGMEPTLRRQTLLPDEHGYLAVGTDAHDQLTARILCATPDEETGASDETDLSTQ